MSELEFRNAWQRRDQAIERDAETFWRNNNALPQGVDTAKRLSELCVTAYAENELLGVSTTPIRVIDFLRCKLAMLRVLVSPNTRREKVASKLAVHSRDLLEGWSKDTPAEGVMGLGAVIHSRTLVEHDRHAVYPDTKLAFVGYTQEGFQMRVYWFAHATVSTYWPGADSEAAAVNE